MQFHLISTVVAHISAVCACYAANMPTIQTVQEQYFDVIRGWIQDDCRVSLEQRPPSDHESICVIFRHHGEILGYGTAENLVLAATTALRQVRNHAAFNLPLDEEMKKKVADSISIELELGNAPIPSPHTNIDRFAYTFNEGADGIAVRKGKEWNMRLQSELRLSPYRPVSNVVESLCVNLGVHPTVALSHELPSNEDVTMYSIPTVSFIQEFEGAEIVALYRGDELVTERNIHISHWVALAHLIAEHLIKSTNDNGKMIGGYQPETNTLTDMFATHFVQILSALALEEYTKMNKSEPATQSSTSIIESVANDVHRTRTIDDESASLVVMMLLHSDKTYSERVQRLLQFCEERVQIATSRALASDFTSERPFVLSLLASATDRMGKFYENQQLLDQSNELCLRCFRDIPLQSRLSIIPWIIEPVTSSETEVEFEEFVSELLQIVLASQVSDGDEPDLVGGFNLFAHGNHVIDARGLRMLPFLAKLCQSSFALKSDSFQAMLATLRYTEQLTTSKKRSLRFDYPAMSVGGVRKSTWDASMPTEASAMALLGITEAVKTFKILQSTAK